MRRGWEYTAGAVGMLGLAVAAVTVNIAPESGRDGRLLWLALGVTPLFGFTLYLAHRNPGHRQSRLLLVMAAGIAVGTAGENLLSSAGPGRPSWFPVLAWLYLVTNAVTMCTGAVLIAGHPDGRVDQRWQRWTVGVIWCFLLAPVALLVSYPKLVVLPTLLRPDPGLPNPYAVPWLAPAGEVLHFVVVSSYPVVLGIVVLLARFFRAGDEDHKRLRLLAYTSMAGLVVAALNTGKRAIGAGDSPTWNLIITVFQAPTILLLVLALLLGARVSRYRVLTRFGDTLGHTVGLDEMLPQLAGAVRDGVRASWVRVSVSGDSDGEWLPVPIGIAGQPSGAAELVLLLRRGDEVVGRIECGPARDVYSGGDREMLDTLAGQAATAIANVRLTAQLAERLAELTRSRARIVGAQETERRRIERDMHDGVQQEVVALLMKVRTAHRQEPSVLLAELQEDVRALNSSLRELLHGIHPPVLTEHGLAAAIEARVARLPVKTVVTASAEVRRRRFGRAVEGTAYFVVSEALTNALKHAEAACLRVDLSTVDGQLAVVVRDDGKGLGGGTGSGLVNLRDRVEALDGHLAIGPGADGGTTVRAELPYPAR